MVKDILRTMPSESFAGLAVIDWENWRPLWIRNWDKKNIYRSMSAQLVRRGNPGWTDEQVDLRAKWEFEKAAVNFMSETLKLARSLRPRGWWGYYLFPDCYNYHYWDDFGGYTGHCPPLEVQRNNKLLWLWEQSKALYPSIYMEEVLRDSPQGERFVGAKLSEALRVAELPPSQARLQVRELKGDAVCQEEVTSDLQPPPPARQGVQSKGGPRRAALGGDSEAAGVPRCLGSHPHRASSPLRVPSTRRAWVPCTAAAPGRGSRSALLPARGTRPAAPSPPPQKAGSRVPPGFKPMQQHEKPGSQPSHGQVALPL
nr:PREDICTED: hyaluronidase-like [Apteryx mantelli mantelli]